MAMLRYPSVVVRPPLKPLGQSNPNFMWSKMAAMAIYVYIVKTFKNLLQNQKAHDFETLHEATENGALQSVSKI